MKFPRQTCVNALLLAAFAASSVCLQGSLSAIAADTGSFGKHQDHHRSPRVLVISLDGAKPDLIQRYIATGVLPRFSGLGKLSRNGVVAEQNITAMPSLTAVSHIAIATGSAAVHNDIPSNTFQAVAGTIASSISGFAAPIGGYQISPLGPSPKPTAEPLWVRLRNAGKKVVAATWPGADGADIRINGVVVQPAVPTRVVDYTVPFGAFGGLGATGFQLNASNFASDPAVAAQLAAAGHSSFSQVLATTAPVETFSCSSTTAATCTTGATLDLHFAIRAAALDTTNDGVVNYDTLVFFDTTQGIQPGPFSQPSTGPAYVKRGGPSALFYFEDTGNKVGAGYFITFMAPDLSTVRFVRYGASFIPRNTPVLTDVDDINNNVGFWAPQADFRIPERLSPGFGTFPDTELEAAFEDQVQTFVKYQTRVAQRAISQNPDADLVMVYIEQPDGSEHQFLLTDRRQATNPTDPNSIGHNQDPAKVARYDDHVKFAYQTADRAVDAIMKTPGAPENVFVVSDHGFAPFHTAVSLLNILKNAGVDTTKLAIRTSGPAANIYVNLQGRESGGTVDQTTYVSLVDQVANVLRNVQDTNPRFNFSLRGRKVFQTVAQRPTHCGAGVGFCTDSQIGQDSGDVFAVMDVGYNFDGIQSPGVARLGDPPFDAASTVFSVANFYGAHGHDPRIDVMSATFIAAGPNIKDDGHLPQVNNIDVAPTITQLLGVTPARMDGRVLHNVVR